MFLLEFDADEVKKEASKLLKNIGVKHRLKKFEVKGVSFLVYLDYSLTFKPFLQ